MSWAEFRAAEKTVILAFVVVGWVIILIAFVVLSAALRGTGSRARTSHAANTSKTKPGTSSLGLRETENP
jgi:hypothetical protein